MVVGYEPPGAGHDRLTAVIEQVLSTLVREGLAVEASWVPGPGVPIPSATHAPLARRRRPSGELLVVPVQLTEGAEFGNLHLLRPAGSGRDATAVAQLGLHARGLAAALARTLWGRPGDGLAPEFEQRLAGFLVEDQPLEASLERLVAACCTDRGWPEGEAWVVEPTFTRVRCVATWTSGAPPLAEFARLRLGTGFGPGSGLAGASWAECRVVWHRDLRTPGSSQQAPDARAAGLGSAVAIPLHTGSTVVAVLVFHLREVTGADEAFVAELAGRATALGHLLAQRSACDDLRLRIKRLEEATVTAGIGWWEIDLASNRVTCSDNLWTLLGMAPGDGTSSLEQAVNRLHPEDQATFHGLFRRAIDAREAYVMEQRVLLDGGATRWLLARGRPILDGQGRVIRVAGTSEDITPLVEGREQLAQRKAQLRAILDSAPDVIARFARDHRITYINPCVTTATGLPPEHFLGRSVAEAGMPAPFVARWEAMLAEVFRTGEPATIEFEFATPAGPRYYSSRAVAERHGAAETDFVLVVSRDVTEQRRAEAAVRESETRFRGAFEAAGIGMALVAPDGRFLLVNPSLCRLVGYSEQELLARTFQDITHPDDLDADLELAGRLFRGEIPSYQMEKRYLHRDGHVVWIRLTGSVARDTNDRVLYAIAQIEDISRERAAVATLAASEERMQLALVGTNDGLWDWDVASGHVTFSPQWCRMLGYEPDEVEPHVRSWERMVHPDDMARVMDAVTAHFAQRTPVYETEHRVRRKDGSWAWILDRGKVVSRDGEGRPLRMVGTHVDITARHEAEARRHELEEQVRQMQKLDAVGRMAGGVAHDFNNMLTVMRATCDLLLEEPGLPETARADVRDLVRAIGRAAGLTGRLLTISRRQPTSPQALDLNSAVGDMGDLLRRTLPERITIATALAPGLPRVLIDPVHLDQVLVNLAVNARDAMPDGGRLEFRTTLETLRTPVTTARGTIAPGTWVRLDVTDTGHGMAPEVQAHLFEPFFTTKGPGAGTGLGLATVYGIATQAQAHLLVHSAPGQGTTISVLWPPTNEPAAEGHAGEPPRIATPAGGTVLVVDDEADIRRVVERILVQRGARVVAMASPLEALARLRDEGATVDLVMTDIVMPGMTGLELAAAIHETHPGLPILFMSGYLAEELVDPLRLGPGQGFIRKPFTVDELTAEIQRLLTR